MSEYDVGDPFEGEMPPVPESPKPPLAVFKDETENGDLTTPLPSLDVPLPGGSFKGPLPPDIEDVWGRGARDGTGNLAETTARSLIHAWGLEGFRRSTIHKAATDARTRDRALIKIRTDFVEKTKRKK